MAKEQFLLARQLRKKNANLEKLYQRAQTSQQLRQQRQNNLPKISLNTALPISEHASKIADALEKHQLIIVCGETGSGKTTQLPKICLQQGRGISGQIAHTQPRRLAARTVASRIAEELQQPLGQAVGYKIRFQDKSNPQSYIKLMTDGILLNEIHHDPLLLQYDTVIIDEAHERSLNIDFLLGYIKQLLPKRPDLKVIITSATINPEQFAKHFNQAPIIMVAGRTYPVDILYQDYDKEQISQQEAILSAIEHCFSLGDGDILLFLPTEKDIHEQRKFLHKHFQHDQRLDILPLFSRLSQKEQNRIFHPGGKRRIVLATNVAETSVTVPGIDFVIDSGLARISRYSVRSKIQRLPIEKISQASAKQRAGRCGRLRPGTVIRLYSQEDFQSRPEFTEPEILRTNLASVILQMQTLNLGKISDFPFIDPPQDRQINDGYRLLYELQAVDEQRNLQPLGKQLARFPIDPQLARMLLSADQLGCLRELLIIVSAISVQDPRERPQEQRQAADQAHQSFVHKQSDFLFYLKLFEQAQQQRQNLSQNQYRKWCKQHFLSWQRMREWQDIYQQIQSVCQQQKLCSNQKSAEYEAIHQAILSGLATHIAIKGENHEYLGTRNRKMKIFPGSALFKKPPKTIVTLEIAETSSVYARTLAKIELHWVEPWVQHLISKHYDPPVWKQKPGIVSASYRSNLYGLEIGAGKRVNYCKIDPKVSHEIFIRHALVYGQWHTRCDFLQHNLKLIDSVLEKEEKTRRKDLLVNDHWLEQFYQSKIPANICSGHAFEKWAKQLNQEQRKALYLNESDILQNELEHNFDAQFPTEIKIGKLVLPLRYHFEPGHPKDGVVLELPLELLPQIPLKPTEWLVPGFLQDKCIALLKALPKNLRKKLVPVPQTAKAFCASNPCHDNGLYQALSDWLKAHYRLDISAQTLQESSIEPFYQMGFEIIDEQGEVVDFSKNLQQLKTRYQQQAQKKQQDELLSQQDIQHWDFGDLQDSYEEEKAGYKIQLYPALHFTCGLLQIHTFNDPQKAEQSHQQGLIELFKRQLKEPVKYLQRNIPEIKNICLFLNPIQSCEQIKQELINNAIYQHFIASSEQPIRQQAVFEQQLHQQKGLFVAWVQEFSQQLYRVLHFRQQVLKPVKKNIPLGWIESAKDIQDQDQHLFYPGFLCFISLEKLKDYYRYYQAIEIRLQSLQHNPEKDRLNRVACLPLWEKWKKLQQQSAQKSDLLMQIRWLIEEFRISLFAQQLKTKQKVSAKRIEKLFNEYCK